jgi:hypothetical protein
VSAPSGTDRPSSYPAAALLDGDDPTLFPKLTDQQLELLTPLGQVREAEVDEVLFRDGDAGYDPMVVLAGRVAVLVGSGEDTRELVGQQPGDLMVELICSPASPSGQPGSSRKRGASWWSRRRPFGHSWGASSSLATSSCSCSSDGGRRWSGSYSASGSSAPDSIVTPTGFESSLRATASRTSGSTATSLARRACWVRSAAPRRVVRPCC